jgi:hypothetical protein
VSLKIKYNCVREVDGVTMLEHVFIARKLGVDHHYSWKKRYHSQEY